MSEHTSNFGTRQSAFSKPSASKTSNQIIIYAVFVSLVASNIALGLALTMGSEISQLWLRAKDPVLVAYESRILQLRMEVDRLHSQQYLQAGNLNLQLQELLQQQEILTEQHEFIQVLVEKAQDVGLTTASASAPTISLDQTVTGSIFSRSPTQASQSGQVEEVQQTIASMALSTNQLFDALFDDAQSSTRKILDQLRPLGINPKLNPRTALSVGGPFVSAQTGVERNTLISKSNQTLNALDVFEQARSVLNAAPIHFPLAQVSRISSPFGSRPDPFGGRPAFHSGIDYPAPTGTAVFSAGQGTVIFAGRRGGYGNMIEIEHNNGLITRYGHLSSILVSSGQQVKTGFRIGNVGSTGRSTGPHLHFEIRRDQTAINPQSFLDVSRSLKEFIG